MKLGNGKNKYVYKFQYKDTGRITIKNVYADDKYEAMKLFLNEYKNYNISLIDVKGEDIY
jgi:hypothetical protein